MSQDQKFIDMFSLVIGGLMIFAVAILVLAFRIADGTQGEYVRATAEYQEGIEDRIRPVGQVALPGEDAPAPQTPTTETVVDVVAAPKSGPEVYSTACLVCHDAGIAGAPILGDAAAWAPRIAQGADVLNDHAINGFTGAAGYMPPRGGYANLSDEEVIAAVQYMIDEAS